MLRSLDAKEGYSRGRALRPGRLLSRSGTGTGKDEVRDGFPKELSVLERQGELKPGGADAFWSSSSVAMSNSVSAVLVEAAETADQPVFVRQGNRL